MSQPMHVQWYPSNAIVDAAYNISYRPLLQAIFFFTSVVIEKLGKLVRKQNCTHDFLIFYI
jgi:hypothetical protein